MGRQFYYSFPTYNPLSILLFLFLNQQIFTEISKIKSFFFSFPELSLCYEKLASRYVCVVLLFFQKEALYDSKSKTYCMRLDSDIVFKFLYPRMSPWTCLVHYYVRIFHLLSYLYIIGIKSKFIHLVLYLDRIRGRRMARIDQEITPCSLPTL